MCHHLNCSKNWNLWCECGWRKYEGSRWISSKWGGQKRSVILISDYPTSWRSDNGWRWHQSWVTHSYPRNQNLTKLVRRYGECCGKFSCLGVWLVSLTAYIVTGELAERVQSMISNAYNRSPCQHASRTWRLKNIRRRNKGVSEEYFYWPFLIFKCCLRIWIHTYLTSLGTKTERDLIKKTMTYGDYGRYVVKLTMDMNMPAEASKIAEDFMFKWWRFL